jgi:ParB-like chromosome segregation protein Spo0J
MAALKDLAESRGTLLNFDPRKIKVKTGLNVRDVRTEDNQAHIENLAQSIADIGVKTPLVIFLDGDEAYVVDGHCRLAATMLAISRGAEIATIPCIPEPRGTSDAERVLSQVLYNSGKTLSPLELGAAFRRSMQMGLTIEQISHKTGRSVSWITQMIDFQGAPKEIHEMVSQGAVSATLAAKVHKERGREAAKVLTKAVETAKESGLTRATERHVAPKDLVWARVRKIATQAKRPDKVTDEDLFDVLELLREP